MEKKNSEDSDDCVIDSSGDNNATVKNDGNIFQKKSDQLGACNSLSEESPPKNITRMRAQRDGEYSDPVFKKISVINGEINKMSREQLQERLTLLKLDTRGVNDVLKKRLKAYYKKRKLMRAHVKQPSASPNYDYLLVIDYEATCEENNSSYNHEIIEFPIVLVDIHKLQVVDEFHAYCKPVINPTLSEFCTTLTGIKQEDVDSASVFPTVLSQAEEWMKKHKLGEENTFAVVTDGPWDMSRFLCSQCIQSQIPFPKWGKKWINLRKAYGNFYHCQRKRLEDMLIHLGMTFEGNQHCGLHDSRNIARITIRMIRDGWPMKTNEVLGVAGSVISTSTTDEEKDKKDKEIKRKQRKKSEETSLEQSMKNISLNDCNDDGVDDDDEDENVDDLLQYYQLQKS